MLLSFAKYLGAALTTPMLIMFQKMESLYVENPSAAMWNPQGALIFSFESASICTFKTAGRYRLGFRRPCPRYGR